MISDNVAKRLDKDLIIWITTVRADGQPQSAPVWYVRDGDDIRIWSMDGQRITNLRHNTRVSLHLNDDGRGDNIVIIEAEASIDQSAGPGSAHPEFARRYQPVLDSYQRTWDWFDRDYPVPLRIRPTRIRAW
ncbi:MAG: pyridoxamine 5'-phosphate oxidase family protein [Acidimicrobiia bacterium]